MAQDRQALDFSEIPEVAFAANVFANVPVILQYEDEVLIEFIRMPDATYTTSFTIYDGVGGRFATVQGTQIYPSPGDEREPLALIQRQRQIVAKHGHQALFTIERTGPGALKLACELYAPDGRLIVAPHDALPVLLQHGDPVALSGVMLRANRFTDIPTAVQLRADGLVTIGGVG